ncbi:MAG TPA: DUF4233 domain-containing protein [Jatrophihabitantaceae bacterium]
MSEAGASGASSGQAPEPTPEQVAERARRADKATRRAMAGVLGLQALVVLLVPRAIKFTVGLGATRTTLLITLAVLLVIGAALVRRPWGIAVGTALQVPFILTGVWIGTMFFLGAVFAGIWAYLLNLRHELVGTPGGVRMLYS